jgi:HEPN superfamily RiboL-PSP-like protein
MPSKALLAWKSDRARALNEIENAQASIGGTGPGRRYATQQVHQAYAVMVASQFQGFCRDLHTESVTVIVDIVQPPPLLNQIVRNRFMLGRQLESKNAQPSSLGSDFGWFGIGFWKEVDTLIQDGGAARSKLEELNAWRNAIAHQNFESVSPGGPPNLTLEQVRQWRGICNKLARTLDRVMWIYLRSLRGKPPWPA